jgi:hypothetical protein
MALRSFRIRWHSLHGYETTEDPSSETPAFPRLRRIFVAFLLTVRLDQ